MFIQVSKCGFARIYVSLNFLTLSTVYSSLFTTLCLPHSLLPILSTASTKLQLFPSDMSAFNHLFRMAIRDLATAYNSRDIHKLMQFYESEAVSSQYSKPRWVDQSLPLTYITKAAHQCSTYSWIPNVPYIPQLLRLFLETPFLRLVTRGISGTRDLMAWEWEYSFMYTELEPWFPGIPTGQILTMRGVSLIRFYVENLVCKVVSQRDYCSLVDWTECFTEPWPNIQ
jgi:hypothetical protein